MGVSDLAMMPDLTYRRTVAQPGRRESALSSPPRRHSAFVACGAAGAGRAVENNAPELA
jgi:hypothetical protein